MEGGGGGGGVSYYLLSCDWLMRENLGIEAGHSLKHVLAQCTNLQ